MSTTQSDTSVLLVEDDVRLSELVSRYLETSGMRVTAGSFESKPAGVFLSPPA